MLIEEMKLGAEIDRKRLERNMSGRKLAEAAGVTVPTAYSAINKPYGVRFGSLKKICDVLGIKIGI